jgi:hypothetical protein
MLLTDRHQTANASPGSQLGHASPETCRNMVLLNLQAEKLFGGPREELHGRKVKNIIPEGFAERLVADDLPASSDTAATSRASRARQESAFHATLAEGEGK